MWLKRQKVTMQIPTFLCARKADSFVAPIWEADAWIPRGKDNDAEMQHNMLLPISHHFLSQLSWWNKAMKRAGGGFFMSPCLFVLHRESFHNKTKAEKSQRDICSLTLCLRATTKVECESAANSGTCRKRQESRLSRNVSGHFTAMEGLKENEKRGT